MSRNMLFALSIAILTVVGAVDARAYSPTGWSPIVIPTGAYRERIKSMPIHQRPGRPLHVYGNTIRLIEHTQRSHQPIRPLRQIFLGSPSRPIATR